MITPRLLDDIRYQLRSDRCSALVFFVLAGIWEEGHNSCDTFRTRNLARMDHNAKFHESRVDLTASGADNVDIVFTNRLRNAHAGLADSTFCHFSLPEGHT